ncbi:hypothetical protein [Ensifer adhaerens]|uniref:hypothetical protein n=1 Tax=Ensifer adhaerens TaxID=106592 RepID=UPI000DC3DCD1|nr:hypothetical protein [Ensifer adhaerens]RAS13515.1 hypothetical protein DEU52_106113 [Ensifer adhaerens]
MERLIEQMASSIFESWGGPWRSAPEFRRAQARSEALKVLENIRSDEDARAEAIDFMANEDMGDLSASA